ncbi:MAG: glycosyltransferase, partial [Bdellovibrionaceae bacterium]|nr:glycosyltransferase [Pseudobdellovibrionaceae bacterium]
MTATYMLPPSISEQYRFRSRPVDARRIRAIIPTYKDWDGLKVTLDSLLSLETPPFYITIANDNPDENIPGWLNSYPVEIIQYPGNKGPAEARNIGFSNTNDKLTGKLLQQFKAQPKSGKEHTYMPFWPGLSNKRSEYEKAIIWEGNYDWVYFTDCGCTHCQDLFLKYEETWRNCGDCCVAISGPVTGLGSGAVNDYMTEQGILNPPLERDLHGVYLPQAIITANALIAALPFAYLQGFDTNFKEAAGEDLDMGIRLRQLGVIAWAKEAVASHRFDEDESDFCRRFRRYGRGNRALEVKHGLPCLRARPIEPDKKTTPITGVWPNCQLRPCRRATT